MELRIVWRIVRIVIVADGYTFSDMRSARRDSSLVLCLLALAGATAGLTLTAVGWLWGMIPLLIGGTALIMIASGRPSALPRSALGSVRALQTDATAPASARRPSRLAVGFMFVLGFAAGMVLDRVLTAVLDANVDMLAALSSAIADARLVETPVRLGDETLIVKHSELDIGQVADIFDNNFDTLIRGKGDNPFIFEVRYPRPRAARAIALDLATMDDYEIELTVTKADGRSFILREEGATRLVDPSIEFAFPNGSQVIQAVRVVILDRRPPPQEGFHTHVRGFALR